MPTMSIGKIKIFDIFICTAVTGCILLLTQSLIDYYLPIKGICYLILKLSVIGTIGLATFLIMAKIKTNRIIVYILII